MVNCCSLPANEAPKVKNGVEKKETAGGSPAQSGKNKPVGVALYNYKANLDSPGGFKELNLHQGEKKKGFSLM